ncbi:hypothetical protein [Sphingomonas sp. S2-65]|uniref:hypothetical protein n=1 Tax=Sphingomonas sp. S2-65 TaxID=2903960 RepID=UPI001F3A1AE2|nr:hypothetical protein [Sphingomonas sp. S2-65]UYY57225.1 hypothetical protein LZ586_11055 [Sphingomonas sp. S2-65]
MKMMTLLALPIAACALPADAQGRAERAELPTGVRAFLQKRDRCDHFRGEELEYPAGAAEIAAQLDRLCTGSDAELARLKRTHARKPAVLRVLARYAKIE